MHLMHGKSDFQKAWLLNKLFLSLSKNKNPDFSSFYYCFKISKVNLYNSLFHRLLFQYNNFCGNCFHFITMFFKSEMSFFKYAL